MSAEEFYFILSIYAGIGVVAAGTSALRSFRKSRGKK